MQTILWKYFSTQSTIRIHFFCIPEYQLFQLLEYWIHALQWKFNYSTINGILLTMPMHQNHPFGCLDLVSSVDSLDSIGGLWSKIDNNDYQRPRSRENPWDLSNLFWEWDFIGIVWTLYSCKPALGFPPVYWFSRHLLTTFYNTLLVLKTHFHTFVFVFHTFGFENTLWSLLQSFVWKTDCWFSLLMLGSFHIWLKCK